jgi:hypothetical protein
MRRTAVLAVLSCVAAVLVPAGVSASAAGGLGEDDELGPSAPEEHRYLQKTSGADGLPRHAYDTAAAQALQLPATANSWHFIGPTNIGGRIVSVALDPGHRDVVYVASASGGIWKSTDAGQVFAPAWPEHSTQAMGAVATAPDGTVFAGTGEPNPGGGSITYEGTGLYVSRDGGSSWKFSGLRDSGAISAITIDPRNPDRMFVAAAGSLYNGGGQRGVYRSLDGGRSWIRVLAGANDFTGATEVFLDPRGNGRMYAVLWDHRRTPALRQYGGVGSGVFRSSDGGSTWQRLDSLVPSGPMVGRIGIGLAPGNPDRLYAIRSRGNTGASFFDGFLRSNDGGTTWTELADNAALEESQSSYPWWFSKVWVDPADADHVHVAGISLMTTRNAGQSWTADGRSIHADQHAMVWDPRYRDRVYLGNDGGMYRSDRDGDGGWVKASYQPYMQFYSAAITPQDVTRYSGGAQDNGSLRSWGADGWEEYVGGDGEENQINPANKDNVFACYQYGNCFRSTDGGDSLTYFTGATVSSRRNWFSPIEFDRTNPAVLYTGGNRLNRSADGGVTWTVISPDLTGGPGPESYPFGTITTIAASGPVVYVGTDDGRVWVTRDTGATWTLIRDGGIWVSRIAVSGSDPGRIWITLSGYRAGSDTPYVLSSGDYGTTWTDLSGNLPQAPVNDVIPTAGGALYVATDQGVFTSPDGTGVWSRLGADLPMVPVDDIEYDPSSSRLVAATFGRGFYQTTVG